MPVLFAHFSEHQTIDPSTTFWGFIKEHYQGKFELDEDYQRDNQLPFRTADCIANALSVCEMPATTIEVEIKEFVHRTEFININDNDIPHRSTTDVFQPPRYS